MIIDFLHDDVRSLRACALVSRSWLPSSRFHLFYSCTIRVPSQFAVAFPATSTSSDVGTYVRQLTIVGEWIHGFTFGRFRALLFRLPHLRRLNLRKVTFVWEGDIAHARDGYSGTVGVPNNTSLPQDTQRRHAGLFALEELKLLECDATTANYAHLFRLLVSRPPCWVFNAMRVAVQHLHTFNVPFPIIETLLTTLGAANAGALHTFWYDDDVLDWSENPPAIGKFGTMVASLRPSHPQLRCLVLGPLPLFEDRSWFERGAVVHLRLASLCGLRTFHLRGRRLEPHLAGVFAALPDTVHEARFVVVEVSRGGVGIRNSFHEFALAFEGELARRTQMTFVLDLGIAKRRPPPRGELGVLRDWAEKGLVRLAMLGQLIIDESPKEQ